MPKNKRPNKATPKNKRGVVDLTPRAEAGDQEHVKRSRPGSKPPKLRPETVDVSPRAEEGDQEHVKKKASGGLVCRGMGAATRGGRYKG